MRVVAFSIKPDDRLFLDRANAGRHELVFQEPRLGAATAPRAAGADAVCPLLHDHADAAALEILARGGTRHIARRCADSTMSIWRRRRA